MPVEPGPSAAPQKTDARPPTNTAATDALENALRDCLNRYGRPADRDIRLVAEGMESLLWVYGYKLVSNRELMGAGSDDKEATCPNSA